MRVVQCSLNIIDSRIGHAAPLENLQPLLRGFLRGDILDHAIDLGPMLDPIAVCHKTGVCLPLRKAESIGEHAEEPVVAAAEENVSVAGLVAAVGHDRCWMMLVFAKIKEVKILSTNDVQCPIFQNPFVH